MTCEAPKTDGSFHGLTYRIHEDRTIRDLTINEHNRANLKLILIISANHRERSSAIADIDLRVQEAPVPDLRDTNLGLGDPDVADSELLIADVDAVLASLNFEIGHVTTGTCGCQHSVYSIKKLDLPFSTKIPAWTDDEDCVIRILTF